MGLSLEFLLGNNASILQAYADEDFDLLDEPGIVEDSADLSLHILPEDLDRLSLCMARYSGRPPLTLRSHLMVQVDEPTYGALTVSSEWLDYAAAVPTHQLRPLVEDWFAKMAADRNMTDITVTDEALEMVNKLLALCRRAHTEQRILIHTWVG